MGVYFQGKRKEKRRKGNAIVDFSSHSVSWMGLKASRDKQAQNSGFEVGGEKKRGLQEGGSCWYRCEYDSVSLWASSMRFSVVPCSTVACRLSLTGLTPPLWPPQFLASGKFLGQ